LPSLADLPTLSARRPASVREPGVSSGELDDDFVALDLHGDGVGAEAELAAGAGLQICRIAGVREAFRRRGGKGLQVGELEAEEEHAGGRELRAEARGCKFET